MQMNTNDLLFSISKSVCVFRKCFLDIYGKTIWRECIQITKYGCLIPKILQFKNLGEVTCVKAKIQIEDLL